MFEFASRCELIDHLKSASKPALDCLASVVLNENLRGYVETETCYRSTTGYEFVKSDDVSDRPTFNELNGTCRRIYGIKHPTRSAVSGYA
ncbi:hypothetical protein [Paraburkholderia aspalathi]|uniref:Uncharacterized protein n=1 Tax=Paraburkholderia aspalathi TaxID=1324617 RepID=A0A1I7ERV6_9BURK|nr:hypothetical protein [Paraburkholderia aspalathi]SFU26657.1 hypothetical protein SAMN05192563_106220 [Paraburkholderia aspalathi]